MTEEVREASPFAISSIAVQRSVALRPNEDNVVFSAAVDTTAPDWIKWQLMDGINALVERERLRVMLAVRQKALEIAQKQPVQIQKRIAELQAQRAAFVAVRERRKGSRAAFYAPSENDRIKLQEFDNQISAEEVNAANAVRDIPLIEWEIARILAGMKNEEPPPRPAGFEDQVSEMQPAIEAAVAAIKAGAA
jgi:restriction endonuclease Mrr